MMATGDFDVYFETQSFKKLSEKYVLKLFQSDEDTFPSQEAKWKAMLKWVKHDKDRRTDTFFKLFKLIKLERLSSEFLRTEVKSEQLVKNSHECKDLLLDHIFARSIRLEKPPPSSPQTDPMYTYMKPMSQTDFNLNMAGFSTSPQTHTDHRQAVPPISEFTNQVDEMSGLVPSVQYQTDRPATYEAEKLVRGTSPTRQERIYETIDDLPAPNVENRSHGIDESQSRENVPSYFSSIRRLMDGAAPISSTRQLYAEPSTCAINMTHIAILGKTFGNIKCFNPTNKVWSSLPQLKHDRLNGFVCIGGRLYVLKGKDIFVLQNKTTWVQKSSIPRYPDTYIYTESVAFQDQIYVVGKDRMYCYDPTADSWRDNLPGCGHEKWGCAVAASDDFIYAMGGHTTTANRYNPVTQTWSSIASMKTETEERDCDATMLNGKVYVIARDDGLYCDSYGEVEYYDPRTNIWTAVANLSVSRPLAVPSACVVGNRLYAVGEDENDPNSIEIYDESSNKWEIVERFKAWRDIIACGYNPDL